MIERARPGPEATTADELAGRRGDAEALEALRRTWSSPRRGLTWLGAVQNTTIAGRYIGLILLLFVVGGAMAILMRIQLAFPGLRLLSPDAYNALFTMHGSTMMFLVAVPLPTALAVLLLPQMLGTRDLPFPRLTALGFWGFLLGTILLYASFFFGDPPRGGWFAYVPLTLREYMPGKGMDFWLLGVSLIEITSLGTGVELIVSVLKTRAPGMSVDRLPVFAWAMLVVGFMILFAFTPLLVATAFLELDRAVGTRFFHAGSGGTPLLWQHLFWIFGHPEVYIQFLPATGVVSMVVAALSRRPLVGYTAVVLAIVGTGVMSFGLWVHHMYTVGLPLRSMSFFTASSLVIAIFSAVQVFAWIATLWGGRPVWNAALLYVVGTIVVFVAGGLTGVMVALVPFDRQVHDSYFVVAHFHYVLIGGVIFPLLAALHYWLPKLTGRLLSERLGTWSFALVFLGFNAAFLPMHATGLLGMPRRVYTFPPGIGWDGLNLASSLGAYVLGAGVLLFLFNVLRSLRSGPPSGQNPWNAGTLEWATPTPVVNPGFFTLPVVRSRYPLWDQRTFEAGDERTDRAARGLARHPLGHRALLTTSVVDAEPQAVARIPGASYWPLAVALSLGLFFVGALASSPLLMGSGLAALAAGLVGWHRPRKDERPSGERERPLLHGLPAHAAGPRSLGWWGMALLVVILLTATATLVFSYFYLWALAPADGRAAAAWPPAGMPQPGLGLSTTVVAALLGAAAAWSWADRSLARGLGSRARLGMGAATFLAAGALALEVALGAGAGFGPQANAYASIFLVTLGFHGAATAAGVIMMGLVFAWTCMGCFDRWRRGRPEAVALYGYFLAGSWILIYGTLYLSPRLL